MSRFGLTFDDLNTPFPIPPLTVNQGRVLRWHYENGRKIESRYLAWNDCIRYMEETYGGFPFDEATDLRDKMDQPLLIFEPKKPLNNRHRLDERFFRNPIPLFEAIRRGEADHNAKCDKIAATNEYHARMGKDDPKYALANPQMHVPDRVPLTPMPSEDGTVGVPARAAQPVHDSSITVGSIVRHGDGYATVVMGPDGLPALRPLGIVRDDSGQPNGPSSSPKAARPDEEEAPAAPVNRTGGPRGKAKPSKPTEPAAGKASRRGREVA